MHKQKKILVYTYKVPRRPKIPKCPSFICFMLFIHLFVLPLIQISNLPDLGVITVFNIPVKNKPHKFSL